MRRGGRSVDPGIQTPIPGALDALTDATRHYSENHPDGERRTRRPSIILALLAAAVAGVALLAVQPFRYPCAALIRMDGGADAEQLAEHRRLLLDYASQHVATESPAGARSASWSVDAPGPDQLRLCLTTTGRDSGLERVRVLAEGFINDMQTRSQKLRTTATPQEKVLHERSTQLQAQLAQVESLFDTASAKVPTTDPRSKRASLLEDWHGKRDDFVRTRRDFIEAARNLDQLASLPPPEHGIVPTGERQEALERDEALQQDLRELEVQLVSARRELLNVRDSSAAPLTRLKTAAQTLATAAATDTAWLRDSAQRVEVERFSRTALEYVEAQQAFAAAWEREFADLAQDEVDPYDPRLIEIQLRLRKLLADFLFVSGKHLADLRRVTQALGEGPGDQARYHVLHSDLLRSYQTVQAAHHRFEFAASAVESAGNFRLDASLRGARGLHRRSKTRIRHIDNNLHTRAVERARQERTAQLAEAQQVVRQTRDATEQSIDSILGLQEQLNLKTELTEDFLQALVDAQLALARMELTREDLETTEQVLTRLQAQRDQAGQARFELLNCKVIGPPVNLGRRLGLGTGAALFTFLAVYFGQWWLVRRT